MSQRAESTYTIKKWDENPIKEMQRGAKIHRAVVHKVFTGDIEGESTLEYLLVYDEKGHSNYVGIELVVGSLGGKEGTFVLRHTGSFGGGIASGKHTVVPGSGTGKLTGLRGSGEYSYGHEDSYPMLLDYDFE